MLNTPLHPHNPRCFCRCVLKLRYRNENSTCSSSSGSIVSVASTAKPLTVASTGGNVSVKEVPRFVAGPAFVSLI